MPELRQRVSVGETFNRAVNRSRFELASDDLDEDMRAWWLEGRLCLTEHGNDKPCVVIKRGPLAELILAALELPAATQAVAWIEVVDEDKNERLSPAQILKLSLHPNCPIII